MENNSIKSIIFYEYNNIINLKNSGFNQTNISEQLSAKYNVSIDRRVLSSIINKIRNNKLSKYSSSNLILIMDLTEAFKIKINEEYNLSEFVYSSEIKGLYFLNKYFCRFMNNTNCQVIDISNVHKVNNFEAFYYIRLLFNLYDDKEIYKQVIDNSCDPNTINNIKTNHFKIFNNAKEECNKKFIKFMMQHDIIQ